MNWLLIIIVLLLALCVVNGYRKGFLRMMYSMVSWVIMFALVTVGNTIYQYISEE